VFLPARSKAGLGAGFRIHDLRHTAASQFPGWLSAEDGPGDPGACQHHDHAGPVRDLYPGDMDRYADRLDSAADEAGKAKTRPDDGEDQ